MTQQTAASAGLKEGGGGYVFMMQTHHWGSWVYEIASVAPNGTGQDITFGAGGFQEARGGSGGSRGQSRTILMSNHFEPGGLPCGCSAVGGPPSGGLPGLKKRREVMMKEQVIRRGGGGRVTRPATRRRRRRRWSTPWRSGSARRR